MRTIVVLSLLAFTGACATPSSVQAPFVYDSALLDGTTVFGYTVEPAPQQDLLAVTDQMRDFVDPHIRSKPISYTRFRRLMKKLSDSGYFVDQYDPDGTYSAAQTFELRKGNCLGYTNLFIALAREAGLEAHYQLMDGGPVWNVASGYLIRNNHINVVLDDVFIPGYSNSEITVDFNYVHPDPYADRRQVSDAFAESLFYANLGVDHLQAGDMEQAFAYLKRAILTEPENRDLWNNLGALFSALERYPLSQAAYEHVLLLDPDNETAMSGMASALKQQERYAEAEQYARVVHRYKRTNAYYHYALAEEAYRNGLFSEALAAVDAAIDIKRNNPRFFALRAASAERMGDDALAAKSRQVQHRLERRKRPVQVNASTVRFYDGPQ